VYLLVPGVHTGRASEHLRALCAHTCPPPRAQRRRVHCRL